MNDDKTWQSIREDEIRELYERTKACGGYNGAYGPFRRYVTQADLGGMYIDAPSAVTDAQPDDLTEGIWLVFE